MKNNMKTKDIKKLLLLIALTILLVGLVCAATTNKTTDNKDTKILKETQKSPSNTKVKTTGIKTIDKKTNTSKENKAKTKKSQSKTYTTTASSFKELYNKVEDAKDYKYENYASYTINLKKGDYISTKELEWNNIIWEDTQGIKKLTINGNGATINGQNKHRFITVYEKSTLTLNNIKLTNFKSDYGGAIKNNGNLIIQNSNLKNNKATNVGGAIYTFKNKVTISKTKLDTNTAVNDGGSIYSYKGTITIKNSILNNHIAKYGGVIYNTGYTKIYDSTLNNNKAKINGGAIYNQDSKLTITNTKLNTNKAVDGGAIENYNGTISITKSTLNKNKVTGNGGAVDNYAGILKLKYSILNNNQAKYGGAVYLDQITKKNIIKNNIFKSNKAKGKSGTIYDNTNTKKVVLSNNIIDGKKTNSNNNQDTSTNKIKLSIITPSDLKTDGKIKITVKALNGTKKLNDGKIKVKFNNKEVANKYVYNGKIKLNYKLPIKSGKYKLTAIYTKNGKKLATKYKNIIVKVV